MNERTCTGRECGKWQTARVICLAENVLQWSSEPLPGRLRILGRGGPKLPARCIRALPAIARLRRYHGPLLADAFACEVEQATLWSQASTVVRGHSWGPTSPGHKALPGHWRCTGRLAKLNSVFLLLGGALAGHSGNEDALVGVDWPARHLLLLVDRQKGSSTDLFQCRKRSPIEGAVGRRNWCATGPCQAHDPGRPFSCLAPSLEGEEWSASRGRRRPNAEVARDCARGS